MANRLTSTEKYADSWFIDLESVEKLMFYYLIDHVDNAGFYEISIRHVQFHLGISKDEILGAIKGLSRGLLGAECEVKNGDKIYLKNFLKHQKMLPLNPFNSFHINALKSFNLNISFVNKYKWIQKIKVEGSKKKDGIVLENIDTNLSNFINKKQGLESPLVKVEVEVKEEVKVEVKVKEEVINQKPTIIEFIKYAKSKVSNIDVLDVELKFEAWKAADWYTGGKEPRKIKNWKSTLNHTLPHLKKITKIQSSELNAKNPNR